MLTVRKRSLSVVWAAKPSRRVRSKTASEDLLADRQRVCSGAVCYALCFSPSPLLCGFLADCNSVNDFDLSLGLRTGTTEAEERDGRRKRVE